MTGWGLYRRRALIFQVMRPVGIGRQTTMTGKNVHNLVT